MDCFVLSVLAMTLIFLCSCDNTHKPQSLPTQTLTIETQFDERHEFTVQIADEPDEQQTGLMYRKSMPKDEGMLFVFPDSRDRRFWMKDTYLPLDLLFISDDGVIFNIYTNARPLDLKGIPSYGPAKMVLEINAGMAEELDIFEGDKISLQQ